MKTHVCSSAGMNPPDRSAERLNPAPGRRWNVNRAITSAAFLCLGLTGLVLPRAALGQPYYWDENNVASFVKQMLYWPDADPTNKSNAAFRYKDLLYVHDGSSTRPLLTNMASLFGYSERTNAQQAEVHLQRGLTNHPGSALLGNLLLDLYYDRAVAEAILARDAVEQAERAHFGTNIAQLTFWR